MSEQINNYDLPSVQARIEATQDYLVELLIRRDTLMEAAGYELPEYLFKDPPEIVG